MKHVISSETFYKVREPAKPGDEFLEITIEELPNGFEVCVIRGKFLEEGGRTKTCRRTTTIEQAKQLYDKYRSTGLHEGFQPAVA